METRRYTYIDVYYNKNEQEKADTEGKKLIKRGEVRDDGSKDSKDSNDEGGYDYCDQYLKYHKSRHY